MNAVFFVVFSVFVVLMIGLTVIAVRWALRRDRIAREEMARSRDRSPESETSAADPRVDVNGSPC